MDAPLTTRTVLLDEVPLAEFAEGKGSFFVGGSDAPVDDPVSPLVAHGVLAHGAGLSRRPDDRVKSFWAGYAALSITLITGILIFGCAHKLRTVDTREASKKEEWANVEKKHVEQRQQNEQKKTERTATYTRKTTPSPQGPIVEESWAASLSELMASSGVVSVSSGSVTNVGNRHEKAASKVETMRDTKPAGFSLPWWVHGVVLLTIVGYLGWLLWRSGWRPWKR